MDLLLAEIMACTGKDPGAHFDALTAECGTPLYPRIDAPARPEQRLKLGKPSPAAGEPIMAKLSRAAGNSASIDGVKIGATNGGFAARPSGTKDIHKVYAESFNAMNVVGQGDA